MDGRFPDATPEEINTGDATCIICREEMVTAKKLLCGHLFHVHCLRSWLERQNTCPTCRALVVPPESGPGASHRQQGNTSHHQPGSSEASTSVQGSEGGATGDHLSQHQLRLRAAAAAASVYEKSLSYPTPKALWGSPGHSMLPPKVPGSGFTFSQNTVGNSDAELSILKAQEAFIQIQIEILQTKLQSLQQQKADHGTAELSESDTKGKGVVDVISAASNSTASASVTDREQDGEVQNVGGDK